MPVPTRCGATHERLPRGVATGGALSDDRAAETCRFAWGEMTYGELLLDNMRHVQHHAAQLNLLLRQQVQDAPRWVTTSGS